MIGYSEMVDVYIHKYSKAAISHSVCPECAKKQYPDLVKNNEFFDYITKRCNHLGCCRNHTWSQLFYNREDSHRAN
jgi:hypothetical protein